MTTDSNGDSGFSFGDLPEDFGKSAIERLIETPPNVPGYHTLRLIAEGGMGSVFEAVWDKDPDRSVALKTITVPRFQSIAPVLQNRFEREIRLLATIKHPNVVPILDHGKYERDYQQIPYYVMPLLACDLGQVIQEFPIQNRDKLRQCIGRFCEVIEGLAAAHRQGIIHRDIKPKNIFITDDGKWILGDFGLAKLLGQSSELTATIGHMGTTPYAPPEQLVSPKSADSRVDIYPLGVILYQFACHGVRPFAPDANSDASPSETDSIARWQRSTKRISPIPSHRSLHLSDSSLDYIIQKCLAFHPEHRYQSADALLIDLRSWMNGQVVRGSVRERFRTNVLRPLRENIFAVTGVMLVLLTVTSAFIWYSFSRLSENVVNLERDIDNANNEQESLARQLEIELRNELHSILPRLQGEELAYEIRRLTEPAAEFERLSRNAQEIASTLKLAISSDPADRHAHWVINRTAVKPTIENDSYLKHVRYLVDITEANLSLALTQEDSNQKIVAVSDLLRSLRMMLEINWYLTGGGWEKDYRHIWDTDVIFEECRITLSNLKRLDVCGDIPAIRRHLKLVELEYDLKLPSTSAQDVLEICRENRKEYTSETLLQDGCRQLHPWYLAWWIFEIYYETAIDLNRGAEELKDIADGWLDIMQSNPAPAKQQNVVHLIDLIQVQDRRGDVLRRLDKYPAALEIYEENWANCEYLLKFFSSDRKVWQTAEQVVSSFIAAAEELQDEAALQRYYIRQEKLFREMLDLETSRPGIFPYHVLLDAKAELAQTLISRINFAEKNAALNLMQEASTLVDSVLAEDEEHAQAVSLRKRLDRSETE